MNEIKEATFSFGNKLNEEEWNISDDLASEGWSAKNVQEIISLSQNMSHTNISKRVVYWRPSDKIIICNLDSCILPNNYLNQHENKKKENNASKSVSSNTKKTLKEEIRELLMLSAYQRKITTLSVSNDDISRSIFSIKRAKSQPPKYSQRNSITMEQVRPL